MTFSTFQKFLLVCMCAWLSPIVVFSQCPTCTPDLTCTSTDGFPAVCPAVQPNGTAGVYYEEQLTFFMPATLTDPSSGALVTLIDITVSSVSGLPYGLQFTLNDPDSTFHPSAGENYGCATICGVPLLPGNYNVVITVTALVNAFGFDITQVQNFTSTIIIDSGEGSANSFTFDNIADCGELEVNFAATIIAPEPSITTYSWVFGNGSSSTLMSPPTVTYDSPGEYTAVLTTTITNFVLSGVSVSNLSNNWSGDIDDLFGSADPYFNIEDSNGNALYSSAVVDNTTTTTWTDPNFNLSNPPYFLHFFDDDLISAVDDLGVLPINLIIGQTFFDIGNGTLGTITVSGVVANEFTDSITVAVFNTPDATLVQSDATLYFPDPTLVTYIWYRNGIPIANAFDSSYIMTQGGQYYGEVSNEFGCVATSNSILYCPSPVIEYDTQAMELLIADEFDTYQWSFNGILVDGATSFYLPVSTSGNYSVATTTAYGCQVTSAVYILNLSLEERNTDDTTFLFPNPAEDKIFIRAGGMGAISTVGVYDMMGKCIRLFNLNSEANANSFSVANLAPGIYFADVNNNRIRFVKR